MSDRLLLPVPAGIGPDVMSALKLLGEAYARARGLNRPSWDFAVEIEELRGAGLTGSGLRWLVCMGHAEHAVDSTPFGQDQRLFRHGGLLTIDPRTCVVLTDSGADLACRLGLLAAGAAAGGEPTGCNPAGPEPAGVPCWDGVLRQLRLGGTLVKLFRQPAPNQELILSAFQEEGWPARIDDPLSPQPEIDPKQHLRDTVRNLNRNQARRLLRFRSDGTGSGVFWAFWEENLRGKIPATCETMPNPAFYE